MVVEDSKKSPKISQKFCCIICNYYTYKRTDLNKHLSTVKHKNNQNDSEMVVNDSEMVVNYDKKSLKVDKPYTCGCGKIYKYDSGYYRHKKKCNLENKNNIICEKDDTIDEVNEMKEFMKYLIKENSELKTMMMEVIKTGTHNNNNNTTNTITNSNNKAFNLNFFLNETCKNAMNINDFIDSIQLNLSDLERVGDVGFVKGISDIIIKNLNALDVTERPIHCTDKKREVLYVKDEDKWEKEDPDNNKVRKVVKNVANKNSKLLKDFKEKHPDCSQSVSRFSDRYNKLIIEVFGGLGNDIRDNENKIIKNISKVITIDK